MKIDIEMKMEIQIEASERPLEKFLNLATEKKTNAKD